MPRSIYNAQWISVEKNGSGPPKLVRLWHAASQSGPLAETNLCPRTGCATSVRCETVVQPVKVAAVDLAAVGKAEQGLRIEPDAIRFFSRCVVLIGMTKGALALQVIRGRCGLSQSGYNDASPVTMLADRDTTWPEYGWNMTVVALMIPALGIPVFYKNLTKWPCDHYKSGQHSLHLSKSNHLRCRGVLSKKHHFSLVRDRAYAYY